MATVPVGQDPKYIGPYTHVNGEYRRVRLKNGKWSKRLHYHHIGWYTELQSCERCSRIGSPRQVCYRGNLAETLCMSCWNKVKPIYRFIAECRELCLELRRAIRGQV